MTEGLKNLSLKLVPFQIDPPRINKPIQIQPIKQLVQPSSLPPQLLAKLGINVNIACDKSSRNWYEGLLPLCGSCACTLSRQTSDEINFDTTVQLPESGYLNDMQRRNKYKKIWDKKQNKLSLEESDNKFSLIYMEKGGLDEKNWIDFIQEFNKK